MNSTIIIALLISLLFSGTLISMDASRSADDNDDFNWKELENLTISVVDGTDETIPTNPPVGQPGLLAQVPSQIVAPIRITITSSPSSTPPGSSRTGSSRKGSPRTDSLRTSSSNDIPHTLSDSSPRVESLQTRYSDNVGSTSSSSGNLTGSWYTPDARNQHDLQTAVFTSNLKIKLLEAISQAVKKNADILLETSDISDSEIIQSLCQATTVRRLLILPQNFSRPETLTHFSCSGVKVFNTPNTITGTTGIFGNLSLTSLTYVPTADRNDPNDQLIVRTEKIDIDSVVAVTLSHHIQSAQELILPQSTSSALQQQKP